MVPKLQDIRLSVFAADPLAKSPSPSWLPRTEKQVSPKHNSRDIMSPKWTPATTYGRYPFLLVSDNNKLGSSGSIRLFSTTSLQQQQKVDDKLEQSQLAPSPTAKLTHVSESGAAHMVSIENKKPTKRVAKARCRVVFTNEAPVRLIRDNQNRKGDVLGVARVAGIMASKRTSDLIPLCHPIAITKVAVELRVNEPNGEDSAATHGSIDVEAVVGCDGKTGVEMEALTSASVAALTVYDMCKAVDKGMRIEGLRVVLKEGGKSGSWVEEEG